MSAPRPDQPLTGDLAACLVRSARGRRMQRQLLMADQPEHSDLTTPLTDAVRLFDSLNIRYALVGGIAAMYYGRPRFTEDVDFILPSGHQDTLAANPSTMKQCGFDPDCTWKLYHRSGAEIDIWKDEHVDEMIDRAVIAPLAGIKVRIVETHDLIAMKLRSHRPQDDYDICEILKHQSIEDAVIASRVTDEQFKSFEKLRARAAE